MNEYRIQDINIGMEESFEVTVSDEMMAAFKDITGDINPLHNDADFAKASGHPGKVCYGLLTTSFLSTLAGVYLPGERSLIKELKIKFAKPVYPGETITVEGEVTDKNDTFNMIVLKVTMRNDRGEKVLRGSMDVMIRQ